MSLNKMTETKISKFYPAASQPGTLTAALVEAGHYASISSARASLARQGLPETFEITLSGFRDNPETGEPEFVVCRVLVEKTPARFLGSEKTETDE